MSPTELKIHVLARLLADLRMPDPEQKREMIERALKSLVNYAMMRRDMEQLDEAMAQVEQIRIASKKVM